VPAVDPRREGAVVLEQVVDHTHVTVLVHPQDVVERLYRRREARSLDKRPAAVGE
jgi:hypothetical protein